jgi:hypothetical protein
MQQVKCEHRQDSLFVVSETNLKYFWLLAPEFDPGISQRKLHNSWFDGQM